MRYNEHFSVLDSPQINISLITHIFMTRNLRYLKMVENCIRIDDFEKGRKMDKMNQKSIARRATK